MILDHSDLPLVQSIAALRQQIREERLRTSPEIRASWQRQLNAAMTELCDRVLADATTFDGILDDGMEGYLLCFTDHAPESPARHATFVVGLQVGTKMREIHDRRELKRREFSQDHR